MPADRRHHTIHSALNLGLVILVASITAPVQAELPTSLTDKIYKGSGDIDLLTDALAGELDSYLQESSLYLGIDLNEAASGLESAASVGVAIKDITLAIETTMGTYSFNDFFTNSTALILEAGETAAEEFYTLFGTGGGNQITGGNGDYDLANLSAFDDVIQIQNIGYEGEILTASLSVTFLDTEGKGANEGFFDYSAGFEEFAILSRSDAELLESGNFGITVATAAEINFVMTTPMGSPEPETFIILLAGFWLVFKGHRLART
jgi:hypothetical protein